jgi:beta-glucanase (GH16 family)
MHVVRLLPLACAIVALACSEPKGGPSASSSSHFLSCAQDSDCDNLPAPATCGIDGYCVNGTRNIERDIVFEDNFDGSVLDAKSFAPELGFSIRNGEAEYYLGGAENLSLSGGELVLTARAEAHDQAKFTSASVETRGLHSWTYGLFEARILAPTGRGCSPAFWLYPETPGAPVKLCSSFSACATDVVPAWGDIIVMNARSEQPEQVRHIAAYATPSDTLPVPSPAEGGSSTLQQDPSAAYHEYSALWGPERIDWFVDGKLQASFDTTSTAIYQPEGKNPFAQPFHLKLSLAIGGLAEAPVAADYPQTMRVDWVRVTQFK